MGGGGGDRPSQQVGISRTYPMVVPGGASTEISWLPHGHGKQQPQLTQRQGRIMRITSRPPLSRIRISNDRNPPPHCNENGSFARSTIKQQWLN